MFPMLCEVTYLAMEIGNGKRNWLNGKNSKRMAGGRRAGDGNIFGSF